MQEVCAELGVTATAVRQRLGRLQGAGFVTRELVRSGRGRPHHAYRVSELGLRELGDNYVDLALILWREVQRISVPEVRAGVMDRVQHAFAERYGRRVAGGTLAERMHSLQGALAEQGFDVEVADGQDGLPILREHNCPYLELAEEDKGICEMEQAVFRQVLGTDVRLVQCCLDGHSCCEFRTVPEAT